MCRASVTSSQVLNDCKPWPNGQNPICHSCVVHLNAILAAVPDAPIVFSSNWRWTFGDTRAVEVLLGCHRAYCRGRIHGVTCSDADVCDGQMPEPYEGRHEEMGPIWRSLQIRHYVQDAGIERFVVLDDLLLTVENLMRTEPKIGLTAEDAERAIRILRA